MLGRTRTQFCRSAPVLSLPVHANTLGFNKAMWDAQPVSSPRKEPTVPDVVLVAKTHCGRGPFPEDSLKYFASWKEELFPNCPVLSYYKVYVLETQGMRLSPQFYLFFCTLFAWEGGIEGPGNMCRGAVVFHKYFLSHLLSYQLQ